MASTAPRPLKVEHEFTDARLTGFGGCSALALTAERLGLFGDLSEGVSIKVRRRGASDGGALSDLDGLRADPGACRLLGLSHAPSGRRMGEFLAKGSEADLDGLLEAARRLAGRVAPAVIEHEVAARGWVPVFVDGTEIEVGGELFEGSGRSWGAERALVLHGAFVGGLWASGRLHPGGVHAAHGWREQMESDVVPLLPEGTPVWVRADNAYYSWRFVEFCRKRKWDCSVSVTHPNYKAPVLAQLEGLPESAWEDVGLCGEAVLVRHRPDGWVEHPYVVVRKFLEGAQGDFFPVHTVILVSRDDLPLAELVRRHRGRQGQENAFKGPLRDLDLHHPPCRKLLANRICCACGQLAQMLLRAVQFNLLPKSARRHGLRPLIRHFIRTVARLVKAAGRWRLDFAKSNLRLDWIAGRRFNWSEPQRPANPARTPAETRLNDPRRDALRPNGRKTPLPPSPPPLHSPQQTPKPGANAPPNLGVSSDRRQTPQNSAQQNLIRGLRNHTCCLSIRLERVHALARAVLRRLAQEAVADGEAVEVRARETPSGVEAPGRDQRPCPPSTVRAGNGEDDAKAAVRATLGRFDAGQTLVSLHFIRFRHRRHLMGHVRWRNGWANTATSTASDGQYIRPTSTIRRHCGEQFGGKRPTLGCGEAH